MKQIVINEENVAKEEVELTIIRVKAFLVNSKNEILIAHNNHTYQLLGGHKNEKESLEEALIREIREETGIDIELEYGPFLQLVTYHANYFDLPKKVCSKIYYFYVKSDALPDDTKTNYDDLELMSEFQLFYVPMDQFSSFLEEKEKEGSLDKQIGREMKFALCEYQERWEKA